MIHSKFSAKKAEERLPLVFYFPGLGSSYPNMGKALYRDEPIFKGILDACFNRIEEITGVNLQDSLFSDAQHWMEDITCHQLALFSIEYSLAKFLIEIGVKPDHVLSHCFGEFVSAVVFEAVSFEDLLAFLFQAGNLMKQLPRGHLVLVTLNEKVLKDSLPLEVEISIRYPKNTYLISGKAGSIEKFILKMNERNIMYTRLSIPCSFHSKRMIPIYSQLCRHAKLMTIREPKVNYLVSSMGVAVDGHILNEPTYWADVYCKPIDMLKSLRAVKEKVFKGIILEVGPGRSIYTVFGSGLFSNKRFHLLGGIQAKSGQSEVHSLYSVLETLWTYGVNIDLEKLSTDKNTKQCLFCTSPLKALYTKGNSQDDFSKESIRPKRKCTLREEKLLSIFKLILDIKDLQVTDHFFDFGGDSLLALQCIAKANQEGIQFSLEDIVKYPTVELLSTHETKYTFNNQYSNTIAEIPLLPLQVKFFQKSLHWKEAKLIPVWFTMQTHINVSLLRTACKGLVSFHEALRLRFIFEKKQWKQYLLPSDEEAFEHVDCSQENSRQTIEKRILDVVEGKRKQFTLENGPLVRFVLIDPGRGELPVFIILFHHLCMDGVSLQILVQDLDYMYSALLGQKNSIFPPSRGSLTKAVKSIYELARSEYLAVGSQYWESELNKPYSAIPIDREAGEIHLDATSLVEYWAHLGKKETLFLLKGPSKKMKGISTVDVLLTAFVMTLNCFSGGFSQLIDLRKHGRDCLAGVDLATTIGWFTAVHPIILSLNPDMSLVESIRLVHDQLRKVPNNGFTFNLLQYISRIKDSSISSFPKAQIAFNYHGQVDRLFSKTSHFKMLKPFTGNNLGTKATRNHLIDVDIIIFNKTLMIQWSYSSKVHQHKTIVWLAEKYKDDLRKLLMAIGWK